MVFLQITSDSSNHACIFQKLTNVIKVRWRAKVKIQGPFKIPFKIQHAEDCLKLVPRCFNSSRVSVLRNPALSDDWRAVLFTYVIRCWVCQYRFCIIALRLQARMLFASFEVILQFVQRVEATSLFCPKRHPCIWQLVKVIAPLPATVAFGCCLLVPEKEKLQMYHYVNKPSHNVYLVLVAGCYNSQNGVTRPSKLWLRRNTY
jgi:hypothetical protein